MFSWNIFYSVGLGKGPSQPRTGGTLTAGAELRPAGGFAVALDLHAGYGYTAPLDVLAGAVALRASDGKRFGFELAALVPLAGRERAAARVDLRWSVRLGPISSPPMPEKRAPKSKAAPAAEAP